MDRVEELWVRWMQDQNTRTIERLLELAHDELTKRENAEAARKATQAAIQGRLTTT